MPFDGHDKTKEGLPDHPAGLFYRLWRRLIAPTQKLIVRPYRLAPKGWSTPMRIAMLSDLHMADPWTPLARLDDAIARAMALAPDLILLPGDLIPGPSLVSTREPPLEEVAARLGRLRAPQGVFAVMGNHDWWSDSAAQARGGGPVASAQALEAVGITVLSNRAVPLPNGAWLAGLESQEAIRPSRAEIYGLHDLAGTLDQVPEDADTILLAHEPNIFARVPDRVGLTLSGHTHGGQIRFFGWVPLVPREVDRRYLHGHVTEGARHLVISAGIGYSKIPLRIGALPEVTLVELNA